MIVFDTDHLSILQRPESTACERLVGRMRASVDADFAATVVSLEEQMRGWLAAIRGARSAAKQVYCYSQLLRMHRFYGDWQILPFDDLAAEGLAALRGRRIRVGTMDLKIAAIALANGARLASANLRDFVQVPGLLVEDWIH